MPSRWRLLLFASALFATAGPAAAQPPPGPHVARHPPEHVPPVDLLPHQRLASGTAWQPDSTPLFARHFQRGPWRLMWHGNLFLDYSNQGGPRGATRMVSENWLMAMAERPLGRGTWMLRGMVSLEPATVRPRGTPQLFQTGETFRGRPLLDAQHPHDLFMELATLYRRRVGRNRAWEVYLAPVGEPALGPPAYPHRLSAMENPAAPLGHHQQDSTHISFGVLTGGLIYRNLKLEGSWFNGIEPDENRWDFDPIRLNSYSGRFQWNPARDWSLQLSGGRLKDPEALEHGDQTRLTGSVIYHRSLRRGYWNTALLWGRTEEEEGDFGVWTLESSLNFAGRHYLFTRVERADREGLLRRVPEGKFAVTAVSLGYARNLRRSRDYELALGGMVTFHDVPAGLRDAYGDFPVSFHLFLRLRPGRMEGEMHPGHEGA